MGLLEVTYYFPDLESLIREVDEYDRQYKMNRIDNEYTCLIGDHKFIAIFVLK